MWSTTPASVARLFFRWFAQLFPLAAIACGSQSDSEIPPELLEAIASQGESGEEYPEGPYGNRVGQTARNICFPAWRDPVADDFDGETLEETCLADFWAPQSDGPRLLLLNTSALWCAACRIEYGGTSVRPSLVEEARERKAAGFRMLGSVFQDERRQPADLEDAARWAETFRVDFPFGLDAQFQMGAFASASVQPFNMLVDLKTMKIVLVLQGDEPESLWPAVDSFLSASE